MKPELTAAINEIAHLRKQEKWFADFAARERESGKYIHLAESAEADAAGFKAKADAIDFLLAEYKKSGGEE